jgi:hexosaminidase
MRMFLLPNMLARHKRGKMTIPIPAKIIPHSGVFQLDRETILTADPPNRENVAILQELLSAPTGYPFAIQHAGTGSNNAIDLRILAEAPNHGEEGYTMKVAEEGIRLEAGTPAGIFYAIQTLRQMLPVEIESRQPTSSVRWKIGCGEIEDRPRFPWRGYMLDEGRYFQGIKTAKKLLDQMALLKLNRFHWHLTEDQGWRIEIKRYPRLTEIGSKRPGTVTSSRVPGSRHNNQPHDGFYTQDEIREVVEYARKRHIMVIPEIEMPGHSTAALAAYPEYSCAGGPIEVATHFGIFPDIYCAGKPETIAFLENVLGEVADLFPAPYLHIGEDEAPKTRWKKCPDCQQKIRQAGLKNEDALQVYLTNHIARFLAESGRRIIFWSDSFDPEIDETAIVHFWTRNKKAILQAVELGRELVNSAYLRTYLDHAYSFLPLKNTYLFDPVFKELDRRAAGNTLGLEGLMWGEWLPNYRRVEYQTFPRLAALAESGWRQRIRPYRDFRERLEGYLSRIDGLDIGYAPLDKAQPPWYRRIGKTATIAMPKKGIALPVDEDYG